MFSVDGTQDVYGELCELLVAGGYFRARITSLSPFDKIAGGLAWGIQSSREAIDVEFIEDANIGHKIKIGENIEAALCNMNCPFPLAAHQVQGLDFPQIFPVVQWLLKKVISTREENARALREHADLCFKRSMGDVLTEDLAPRTELVPKRVYKRRNLEEGFQSAEDHVLSVLLEYGQKSKLLAEVEADKTEEEEAEKEALQQLEEAELDKLLELMGSYKAAQKLTGKDVTAAMARDQQSIDRYCCWAGPLELFARFHQIVVPLLPCASPMGGGGMRFAFIRIFRIFSAFSGQVP